MLKNELVIYSSWIMVWHYLRDPRFSHFDAIPTYDRHTHTYTDTRQEHTLLKNICCR